MKQVKIRIYGAQQPLESEYAVTDGLPGQAYIRSTDLRCRDWKTAISLLAKGEWKDRPLMTGPIRLTILFCMERPQEHFETEGSLKPSAPACPITWPDLTELINIVENALTGVIWQDDDQVYSLDVRKVYDESPWMTIEVGEIGE